MHVLRVAFLLSTITVIAGCAGLNVPNQQPSAASQLPEFLYVGTSNPGLLTYEIMPDGMLQATPTSARAPVVCAPSLSPVPGRIYVISLSCSNPTGPLEFRRFNLGSDGNVASATGLLSLGPDFPSITDTVTDFVPIPTGKFAYTWSVDNDSLEHISLLQIGPAGDLTIKPGQGLSWPLVVSEFGGETHRPSAVVTTPAATFLIVKDWFSSRDTDPAVSYPVYQVDSETGAIGNKVGEAAIGTTSYISFNTQNGALMVFGEFPTNGDPGDLRLFHIGLDGVTLLQQCHADRPACAHPETGLFHPSGKWLFIVDRDKGGIWTIPVTGNSLSASNASFLRVNLDDLLQFAFSADARSFYVGQWGDAFKPVQTGEILGFQVNDKTGALTPITGSPWSLGKLDFGISAMTTVAGTGR